MWLNVVVLCVFGYGCDMFDLFGGELWCDCYGWLIGLLFVCLDLVVLGVVFVCVLRFDVVDWVNLMW